MIKYKLIKGFLPILFIVPVFFGCNGPEIKKGELIFHQGDSVLEFDNGLVKGIFRLNDRMVTQYYYAAEGEKWILMAKPPARPGAADQDIDPLYDTGKIYADSFRLMAQEGLNSMAVLENKPGKISVQLSGNIRGRMIEQVVSLQKDQDFFHFDITATLPGTPPKIEYLLAAFEITNGKQPDFTFTPSVKRERDDVIGDRKFFAPATIVEKNGRMVALVPDLNSMNDNVVYAKNARPQKHPKIFGVPGDTLGTSLPMAMDLSLNSGITENPLISFGYIDYWVEQHVYWRHENENGAQVRELSKGKLKFGFDLFLTSGEEKYRGYERISVYLWKKYGTEYFHSPRPQAMPFDEYAKICYPASFDYQGYDIAEGPSVIQRHNRPDLATWQQWEKNGIPMGGLRLSAPQWYQFIYNTAWWNNVCDATGIYYWGKKLDNPSLLDKARRIINFTLSSPQNQGLFPGLYNIETGKWIGSLWEPPLRNYDPDSVACYWSWNGDGGAYQTASASVTAGYLLYYRRFCEDVPEILPFVRSYGDFLVRNIRPDGCVPGWFDKSLQPLPSLSWNADGGAHIWVLSELYHATGDKKYADAAEKMAGFMIDEVMPHQKWYDFETFYSCAVKPESFYDPFTGQYPANNMSVSWALEGFASLYEVLHKKEYLKAAEAVADYSIFYQAVWAPHYIITAYPFGGFSSQNSDAEWLDQRSHRFTDGLIRTGLLSERQDLVERGVAAARSSLTLVNLPILVQNYIYKYPNFPLGLGPENIDHEGFPQTPLRSGPSWCEVGGLAAASHALRLLGGLYINFKNSIALGINGVSVENYRMEGNTITLTVKSLIAGLPHPYPEPFRIGMRIIGLEDKEYNLDLNGITGTYKKSGLEDLPLWVYPDGRILFQGP